LVWFALVAAVLGGLIGWIAVFSGFGAWGLALGAAITGVMIGVRARRRPSWHTAGFLASYAFGFLLLTWPVAWFAVGITWYLITGQPLGE